MGTGRGMAHTNPYARWKSQTQDTFDFSVLVSYAIPTLKRNLVLFEKGVVTSLVKADHYGKKEELSREEEVKLKESLRTKALGYKSKLSRYILMSNFSFFEAYVIDVTKELLQFNGGRVAFEQMAMERNLSQIQGNSQRTESLRRKLRTAPKPDRIQRYRKVTKELLAQGFRFPTDLFSRLGVKSMLKRLDGLKASHIPDFLEEAFLLTLSEDDLRNFTNSRDLRNRIAHGDPVELSLLEATNKCKELREIAKVIDKHLVKHYFIIESCVNDLGEREA